MSAGSENGRVSRTQKQLVPWFVESRKVGPINGETTDDSIVDHIFLWCSQGLRDSHLKLTSLERLHTDKTRVEY